jgi:hypothetical protein
MQQKSPYSYVLFGLSKTALPPAAPDERDELVMETIAKRIRQSEGPEPEPETGTAAADPSPEEK